MGAQVQNAFKEWRGNFYEKTTLVIMAAGIGSRFGKGIKQLEPVGKNGEIIMAYSIHDALEAGFNKIVFAIRKDLEEDFKSDWFTGLRKLRKWLTLIRNWTFCRQVL